MKNNNKPLTLSKEQVNTVMALYSSGKIDQAIRSIKALNEDFPHVPLLYNILGACYQSLKQLDSSVKMFETAILILQLKVTKKQLLFCQIISVLIII